MNDIGETFRLMRERSQQKRESNRDKSTQILISKGIDFEMKNYGAHLIVHGKDGIIDFWPGTGKFISRKDGVVGRGVFNLLKLV